MTRRVLMFRDKFSTTWLKRLRMSVTQHIQTAILSQTLLWMSKLSKLLSFLSLLLDLKFVIFKFFMVYDTLQGLLFIALGVFVINWLILLFLSQDALIIKIIYNAKIVLILVLKDLKPNFGILFRTFPLKYLEGLFTTLRKEILMIFSK